MKFLMQDLELLPCDVGVDLSGCDIHVPQHDLDGSQIGTAFQ